SVEGILKMLARGFEILVGKCDAPEAELEGHVDDRFAVLLNLFGSLEQADGAADWRFNRRPSGRQNAADSTQPAQPPRSLGRCARRLAYTHLKISSARFRHLANAIVRVTNLRQHQVRVVSIIKRSGRGRVGRRTGR